MFISLPVSIPLGAISLARASVSGVAMALTKKYQKKLAKAMKLVDIVTSTLVVFETSLSKTLNSDEIDEWELATLQTLHLGVLNEPTSVDCKMKAKTQVQLQKCLLEEMNKLKKVIKGAL